MLIRREMLIRCKMKLLIVLKECLKKYLENLRDVGDQLRRLGDGMIGFELKKFA